MPETNSPKYLKLPLFTIEHGASAIDGAAEAGVFFFELCCFTGVDDQAVIVREFFSNFYIPQRFKENAIAVLFGFQIRLARMINPSRRIAVVLGVDNVPVIQMKIEGVMGLAFVVRMTCQSFRPGDDFAFVFQKRFTGFNGTNGKNAFAVDAGFAYLNATFAIR